MKKIILAIVLGSVALATQANNTSTNVNTIEQSNIALVEKAMDGIFNKRDTSIIPIYWSDKYIQHNPTLKNGRDDLAGMIKSLPNDFKYEEAFATANGDKVIIYGRYIGFKATPIIAADVFRIQDGKLAEHWDVLQDEVPVNQTKSGNPMFNK